VPLVYLEEHTDFETARKREKQIKNWSQEKKEKLIKGQWSKEW
jgi:predicted GIY-YIG superfamily endonuclease